MAAAPLACEHGQSKKNDGHIQRECVPVICERQTEMCLRLGEGDLGRGVYWVQIGGNAFEWAATCTVNVFIPAEWQKRMIKRTKACANTYDYQQSPSGDVGAPGWR